jgi:flagellar protein FlaG
MDINEVASRATAAFQPQRPVAVKPSQPGVSETDTPGDVAASSASSPTIQTQAVQADDPSVSDPGKPSELQLAVEKIQEFVSKAASDINFSIDEDSGRTVVKVIDRETKEVIRQIPSQEMLDLAKAMDKLQGLLIKQKV